MSLLETDPDTPIISSWAKKIIDGTNHVSDVSVIALADKHNAHSWSHKWRSSFTDKESYSGPYEDWMLDYAQSLYGHDHVQAFESWAQDPTRHWQDTYVLEKRDVLPNETVGVVDSKGDYHAPTSPCIRQTQPFKESKELLEDNVKLQNLIFSDDVKKIIEESTGLRAFFGAPRPKVKGKGVKEDGQAEKKQSLTPNVRTSNETMAQILEKIEDKKKEIKQIIIIGAGEHRSETKKFISTYTGVPVSTYELRSVGRPVAGENYRGPLHQEGKKSQLSDSKTYADHPAEQTLVYMDPPWLDKEGELLPANKLAFGKTRILNLVSDLIEVGVKMMIIKHPRIDVVKGKEMFFRRTGFTTRTIEIKGKKTPGMVSILMAKQA